MSEFSTFLEKIKNTKILDAAKDIGINCEIFTSTEIAELYSNHKWSVIQNSQVGKVINAVPDSALIMALSPSSGFLYDSTVVFLTFKRLGILVIDNRQSTIL